MSAPILFDEVKKHKNDESCWVIIHGEVYDLSKFLSEHPGGAESILEVGGQDATQDFEDVGHSDDAREMMKKYKIGPLFVEEKPYKEESPNDVCSSHNASSRSLPQNESASSSRRERPRGRGSGRPRPRQPASSDRWKWIVALGGAILIGIVLHKYLCNK